MGIVCHALESYTARPYDSFQRKSPEERVPYCGANLISDMWSERALQLLARSFRRAVRDGGEVAARTDMALTATFAGLGFGNAGVQIRMPMLHSDRSAQLFSPTREVRVRAGLAGAECRTCPG